MKKIITYIITLALLSLGVAATSFAAEHGLSKDPRLTAARESFEKAEDYMEKGHNEFRRRPGQAQKLFEHAEDYFTKAGFQYKELGKTLGIDTIHEIEICNKRDKQAHVMVNKARKKGSRGPLR